MIVLVLFLLVECIYGLCLSIGAYCYVSWHCFHSALDVHISKFCRPSLTELLFRTMPAKKTQVKEITTHLVHLAGAVSLQDVHLVGELLADWAISSPHARREFALAVRLAQPICVRDVQQEAITKYASEVLPPMSVANSS